MNSPGAGIKLLIYAGLVLLNTGCGSVDKIPVRGQLHDYRIQTTVDHVDARYYLENYLAGISTDPELQSEIESLHDNLLGRIPTREELLTISEKHSVDFAALVFGNQLLKDEGNRKVQRKFLSNLARIKNGFRDFPHRDFLVLLVPGYDYVESGHLTGANLARQKKLIASAGYDVHFLNIDPIGTVEESAAVITDTLAKFKDRKMVIAGASSAGPAIHLSLGKLSNPDVLKNVKGWFNIGGLLKGSPVIDRVSTGVEGMVFSLAVWYKDWRPESFESMRTGISRKRFSELKVPQHIKILNYIGLSLSGDISEFAWDKYLLMRRDGPNDGLTLLPDIIAPNSHSILAPASDHYFAEDPEIDIKTLALFLTLLEEF